MYKFSESQLERISAKVHDAWVSWSKQIQRRVKPVWRERWRDLWVDYDELPEVEKEKDRIWARKIVKETKKESSFVYELGKYLGQQDPEHKRNRPLNRTSRGKTNFPGTIRSSSGTEGLGASSPAGGGSGGDVGGGGEIPL